MRFTSLRCIGLTVVLVGGCSRSGFDERAADPTDVGGDASSETDESSDTDETDDGPVLPAALSVAASLDFGAQLLGDVGTQTLVIANDGRGDATLSGISNAALGLAAPFALSSTTCVGGGVLLAGASCELILTFSPTTPGPASVTLTLGYFDGVAIAQAATTLNGVGQAPTVCDELAAGTTAYDALGSGTQADPHVLCNPLQLIDLMNRSVSWNRSFALGTDLDLAGYDATSTPALRPIGTAAVPFTGRFDGRGHIIAQFTYHNANAVHVGLFGVAVGSATEIKNLTLTDADISVKDSAGVLVASLRRATVSNCGSTGSVSTSTSVDLQGDVGGLIGSADRGALVSGSWSTATVSGADAGCGGLVGWMGSGLVINSYARGDVSCANDVGGLVGGARTGLLIANSYATGDVSGTGTNVGGLFGKGQSGNVIRRSFAVGDVSGGEGASTGILVGATTGILVSDMSNPDNPSHAPDSYGYADATCTAPGGCHAAVTGEAEVLDLSELYGSLLPGISDWDFDGVWSDSDVDFPTLLPEVFDAASWDGCAAHADDVPFAGGRGSGEAPYLLCSAAQLERVARSPTKWTGRVYRVMADIDMSGADTSDFPIAQDRGFWGVFDGAGHRINHFTYDAGSSTSSGAFFGTVNGIVRRVGLADVAIDATSNIAPLAGGLLGTISDCYVTGTLTTTGNGAAMINGMGENSIAYNVYTDVDIDAASGGGLAHTVFGAFVDSFAVGTLNVSTGGGPLVAIATFEAVSSSYFADGSCTGCTNVLGHSVDLGDDPTHFETAGSLPLSAWDFNNVWQTSPGALPSLR